MTPPPTVLVLGHTQVHVCTTYGGYMISYIKVTVDKSLSFAPTLNIPNIKLYNSYI